MSARERHQLTRIEARLAAEDPDLDEALCSFTLPALPRQPASRGGAEQQPRIRTRRGPAMAGMCALLMCVTLLLFWPGRGSGCPTTAATTAGIATSAAPAPPPAPPRALGCR